MKVETIKVSHQFVEVLLSVFLKLNIHLRISTTNHHPWICYVTVNYLPPICSLMRRSAYIFSKGVSVETLKPSCLENLYAYVYFIVGIEPSCKTFIYVI